MIGTKNYGVAGCFCRTDLLLPGGWTHPQPYTRGERRSSPRRIGWRAPWRPIALFASRVSAASGFAGTSSIPRSTVRTA